MDYSRYEGIRVMGVVIGFLAAAALSILIIVIITWLFGFTHIAYAAFIPSIIAIIGLIIKRWV